MKHAKENGYVVTLFGRRRPVPELKSSNFMQRNFGERVAMNAPIQGTAADVIEDRNDRSGPGIKTTGIEIQIDPAGAR